MKSVLPGKIEGRTRAPASKSMMIRAVAAAALARGKSIMRNPSDCDDAKAAIGCAKALGAKVREENGELGIVGGAKPAASVLNCHESGLCMRMFTPIAALFEREIELVAQGSLRKRDVGMVQAPLERLGAICSTRGGLPPVKVKGPIRGGRLEIDGSQSSQFLTGLLMALPLCKGDSELSVPGLKSKPYVKMTLEILEESGIEVRADSQLGKFSIPGGQEYRPVECEIEGDWSGAAFLLVAGAIAGRVEVGGLRQDSPQADRAVVEALEKAGAKVAARKGTVEVEKAHLEGFAFDAADCPDLFPPLAVLACCCEGESRIAGAGRLKGKESDRAAALASELGRMGAKITVSGDEMLIAGGKLRGGEVDSHGDHRIAMACAIAALVSEKGARIEGEGCVSKSFPGFFAELGKLRS